MKNRVLVIGGSGALGRSVCKIFSEKFAITNIDITPGIKSSTNILLPPGSLFAKPQITNFLSTIEKSNDFSDFSAVINTAGGWRPGSASDPELLLSMGDMLEKSLASAGLAAHIAARWLRPGGLVAFIGAASAAENSCSGCIGYGAAKAAVHALAAQLPTDPVFVEKKLHSVCVAPTVLDTEANRRDMPGSDHKNWVEPDELAKMLLKWTEGNDRPSNGSLIKVEKINGEMKTKKIK